MVQLFLAQVPDLLTRLENHTREEDYPTLANDAHALKGMVDHFCAKALVMQIVSLESAARENKIANFEMMTKEHLYSH